MKRYHLLSNQCIKDKKNNLLLGHHLGDLYENFLIRLLRGSGLKGLTSLGEKSEYNRNGIVYLRPLIEPERLKGSIRILFFKIFLLLFK